MQKYTDEQRRVIDYRDGDNMLVSASAGTGKTTVMIERIASLIADGADVSEFAVVTFTNLAAAEMKKRLSDKLAEKRDNKRMVDQLERIDNASISTLHSFCSELLRNYFYVADIDPAFAIMDELTVSALKKQALDDLFRYYFKAGDEDFWRVYKIFSTHRSEENFKKTLFALYDFSRCLENFNGWYAEKRQNFSAQANGANPIIATILFDVVETVQGCEKQFRDLALRCNQEGLLKFAEVCSVNADKLSQISKTDLQESLFSLAKFSLTALPRRNQDKDYGADKVTEERMRTDFDDVKNDCEKLKNTYENLCHSVTLDELWTETQQATAVTDKLTQILAQFDEAYSALKKQRGGLDFNDLEHLTLKLLDDADTARQIRERYKYVFVDEYQDINPVQESIIAKLSQGSQLFMVGDVKQSIYGFRGCEPTIFLQKYQRYKQDGSGKVEELNTNFRSNREILNFVNKVFAAIMTQDFGKVNYAQDAQLQGSKAPCLDTPSVQIDVVQKVENKRDVDEIYDITADALPQQDATQGEIIAQKIQSFVGQSYVDKHGNTRRISYGDIVILMRSLKDKAADIYNTLVSYNIPVTANFKTAGYENKEVRDVITLLRVIDNPFYDIYTVGLCLSPIGGFTENQLAEIKIATQDQPRIPFYTRLQIYAERNAPNDVGATKVVREDDDVLPLYARSQLANENNLTQKIIALLQLVEKLRFVSYGATVDELVLQILAETDFYLYVQGLPNGGLRLRKLYAFADGLKGASYAQSVDRFLAYLDESDNARADEGLINTDAVRIMTMHASKGLEFPVVFVAGLETRFVVDYPAVECNAELGIATRFYDFQSMRVANTLGKKACGMFNRVKQQEEEMRLLYVAMTRAEFVLNLIFTATQKQLESSVIKRPVSAICHMDWLLSILKTKYKSFCKPNTNEFLTNFYDSDFGALLSVHSENPQCQTAQPQDLMCPQYTNAEDVERMLNWTYPYAAQTKMPTKIVSSALDKEYLDVDESRAEYVLEDNADRNFVGTAYHKVYQYVNYNADKTEIKETVEFLVNNCKIEKQYAEQLDAQLIFDTLNNPDLRKIMADGKVYHELPFMLYAPYDAVAVDKRFSDDVMLQGVIDLLVIKKDCAVVIDFKYTSRSDLVRKNYQAQLASYRLAVQRICGIQDVKCYVLSVADNKLIDMN